jgi:hypothetical protein
MPLMSKAEFSRSLGVSRSAVGGMIRRGQISGPALTERAGRILVDDVIARQQLRARLDDRQREANGKAQLGDEASGDATMAQIKTARLRQLTLANERAEAEARERSGELLSADQVRREVGRVASRIVALHDAEIPQLATEISAASKLPLRDAIHLLRTAFRRAGDRMAATETRAASALPEAV